MLVYFQLYSDQTSEYQLKSTSVLRHMQVTDEVTRNGYNRYIVENVVLPASVES